MRQRTITVQEHRNDPIGVTYKGRQNRLTTAVVLLPLLLIVGSSMTALAQRIGQDNNRPDWGITRDGAMNIATETCALITGESSQVLDIHPTAAFQYGTKHPMREWEAICRTESKNYQLRLNADTGDVYGINELGAEPEIVTKSTPLMSSEEADKRALAYLRMLKFPGGTIEKVQNTHPPCRVSDGMQTITFRGVQPNHHVRTISVAIDLRNGALQTLWYPPVASRK